MKNNHDNMKCKFKIIISASVASVLAFSVLAQDSPNPNTDRPDYVREGVPRTHQLTGAAKASDLIGKTVKNNQGEKLGKVKDIAVDVESGRIVEVILSSGGFIGIDQTMTAVPPGALHCDDDHKFLTLDASPGKLKGAPRFDSTKWNEGKQSDRLEKVYAYFGEQSDFAIDHDESWTTNMDGSIKIDRARKTDKARDLADAGNTTSTRNADGTWTQARLANDQESNHSSSQACYIQKASKLMGTPVKNLQNEKLGKVENLLVDLSAGRIVAVVISSGGFIGMNNELSSVPPTALRFTLDRDSLQLDTSKEMLSNAPHFNANQWPDFAQPTYASGVYRAYKVEPYFATDSTANVDNSRQNVRDRASGTLTPLDQGNSQADVDTTAQIRKEIIAGKGMSLNAQNVKIITKDGRVTLRGPVSTTEEKRLIGEIANGIAHSENVDNQLDVKLATNSN
jgi:hyperosmotically inducible protein